ncbi:uncharacterized protein TNCV_229061 [Trichonephila clavipes]|nr:uncharacterized protein TNCV_229061 [Trichonephila clavipes]
MKEEKLLDHVISRLEPQLLDYVEVRHPQTTSNLLQVIDKCEERFLNRRIRGSSREFRDANQSANNRFPNRNRQENWRETRGNNRYSDNIRRQREFNRFEGQGVADNRRFDSRHRGGKRIIDSIIKAFDSVVRGKQQSTIRMTSLRMTPVDPPYAPILLNEKFITALWDTGAGKSFISEEDYRRYFYIDHAKRLKTE